MKGPVATARGSVTISCSWHGRPSPTSNCNRKDWLTLAFADNNPSQVSFEDYHWQSFLMQERNIQRKVRPTHPGAILRNMLAELATDGSDEFARLTQKELAKRLGVSRRTVSELIHERRTMTADMAIRLSRVLKTTPDIWMNLQKAVDLWDAAQTNKNQYAKLRPIAA